MLVLALHALACAPYERYDPAQLANVTARFGEPYAIHAVPEPFLSEGAVHFEASVESGCAEFSLSHEAAAGGTVLVATRRRCDEPGVAWRGRVSLSLPDLDGGSLLLAFPPGSEYELWRLAPPSPLSPLPLLPTAAIRLYVHRAEPKRANPNGPCSTMLEVGRSATVEEVVDLASARLGVAIAALRDEPTGAAPRALSDGAMLVALEAPPAAPPLPLPPPRPPNTCCPAEGCDRGGDGQPLVVELEAATTVSAAPNESAACGSAEV